jgi:fatty acid-binding protein DegV
MELDEISNDNSGSESDVSISDENICVLPEEKDFNVRTTFANYEDFEKKFEEYCKKTYQVYVVRTSKITKNMVLTTNYTVLLKS